MKLFAIRKDGGPDSNVTGYWLIEWKRLFSIALLRFSKGSREAYHSHAFNSISWVLKGALVEIRKTGDNSSTITGFTPSFTPIITTRDNLHKVYGMAPATWVVTFRGPWVNYWKEKFPDGKEVTLTHGRKIVD